MKNLLLIISLTLAWGLKPFFNKRLLKKIDSLEFICIINTLLIIPLIFLTVFLYKKNKMKFLNNIDNNNYIDIFVIVLFSIIGAYSFTQLLRENDASYILPLIQPLIIILTLFLGYFIFNEEITSKQFVGTLFGVISIILITT